MKSINKLLALTLISLFLIACGGKSGQKQITYNFKQGYDGLIISTLENAPPSKVYQNSNFKLILKLENKGAYELTQGQVSLLGFDSKYFSLDLESQTFDRMLGRSLVSPAGDTTFLEFPIKAKTLFNGSEKYVAPYFIKANYRYKTEFTPTICINPKLYEVYDSGCKAKPKQSFSGQGSPLAVTKLETILSPGSRPSVEFRLTLKNKGKGKLNQVRLGKARLAHQPLFCEFRGTTAQDKVTYLFKEKDKQAVLTCTKELEDQNSYSTTLFFEFDFDYSIKKKQTITLMK